MEPEKEEITNTVQCMQPPDSDNIVQSNKKVDRKEYYKQYYKDHKETILQKAAKKETCEFCNRSVEHQNIFKHMKSQYCKNRRVIALNLSNLASIQA